MAEIDTRFYRGTDDYSDGDEVENTLLQLVREGKGFDDLAEMSWPVFYHLNPVRENICSWYGFEKGSRVLEIGAGCGAVTGALCGRGLDIYSVDLSLRRSTINYERHREAEDLHLVVANLNDIEFTEPFDYILLIGVLEYAGRFTEGAQPYQRFLENIRRWLKPEGKLLIAIENRLGLKYFAGAGEDHLGTPFIGLKGYPEDRGVRTFSRSELRCLLQKSGFAGCRFYYPHPDYKFPEEIFTDRSLTSQPMGRPYPVYDMDRVDLFQEEEMAEALRADGVAGAFANSFLAEVSVEETALDLRQDFYARLNRGRRKAFQTGTRITGAGEPGTVIRYALTEEAKEHLARIRENERRVAEERAVLRGEMAGDAISYPWTAGKTLEDALREAEWNQDRESVIRLFRQVRQTIEIKPGRAEYDSEGFTEWFGEARIAERKPLCTETALADLDVSAIWMTESRLMITDCEWVTDFAVPVSYLSWRCAEKIFQMHPLLQKTMAKEDLWEILEIPEENISVYQEWAWHFENRYVNERSLAPFEKKREMTYVTPAMVQAKDNTISEQRLQIEQLEQWERALTEETAGQRAKIEQLIQEKQSLSESAEQAKKDLDDLLHSTSWRMTAGFRAIRRTISGTDKKETEK